MIDLLDDYLPIWLSVFFLVLAGFIVWALYMSVLENRRWKAYAAEHCKIVGKMSGDTSVGVGNIVNPNGSVGMVVTTTTTAGKTGWACDDGITHWR